MTEQINTHGAAAHTATGGRRSLRYWTIMVLGLLLVGAVTCALYIPYLSNKLVFDDGSLFTSLSVFDFAQTPFNFYPRTFPYFTLGFTEVEFHSIEAHRIVSLILHLLNTFMMFRVFKVLLEFTDGISKERALWLALFGAAFFALHPVAVYGAAYLVQRTIVLALLFSLLSIWFYLRALRLERWTDCLTAALFYTLAIFSKEHAIMLPAAVVVLSPILKRSLNEYRGKAAIYLIACTPAALWVVFGERHIVGTTYEQFAANTLSQMGRGMPLDTAVGRWFVSAVSQMGLFFEYLRYWSLPDIRSMSIDMRIDFAGLWTGSLIALRIGAFIACPLVGLAAIRIPGRIALLGAGLLYTSIMFLPELSAVRFQEPFVLYRSYLWAPGIILMAIAFVSQLSGRTTIVAAVVCLPILVTLATERLATFSDALAVWNDAASKLPNDKIVGADRIYFNRSREWFQAMHYSEARADAERVIKINPTRPEAFTLRGQACLELNDYACAQTSFDKALSVDPEFGPAYYGRGLLFEHQGLINEAVRAYSKSVQLGNRTAEIRLKAIELSGRNTTFKY